MIEVDNYLSAEDVMPFKKLALMSDDNFVLTFNKLYQTPITWTKKSNWLSYSRIINWG